MNGVDIWPQTAQAGIAEHVSHMNIDAVVIAIADQGQGTDDDFGQRKFPRARKIFWAVFLLDIEGLGNNVEEWLQRTLSITRCRN